jgi:hypothetical protein
MFISVIGTAVKDSGYQVKGSFAPAITVYQIIPTFFTAKHGSFILRESVSWLITWVVFAKNNFRKNLSRMYDWLYQRLGTKEREKDIYRMAKSRERKTRDIIQVKCIKDETEWLLIKDEDINNR